MRLKFLVLVVAIATTVFAQDEYINLPGFGNLPYIKNKGKFSITFDKIGKLDFKGTLNPVSLETEVKMEQLKNIKGYKIISKLSLEDLKIKVSSEGLFLDANANTRGALKTLCEALKITEPKIHISTLIAKNAFALSGGLDFSKAPIVIDVAPKIGTQMTLESIEIGANVGIEYPGKEKAPEERQAHETNAKKKKKDKKGKVEFSPSIYVTTHLRMRPTSSDPDLKIITEFEYDLVSQEITGAGSMVDTWSNPIGLSKFLPDNSISMTNTALEIGWIPGSPTPTNIGFYLEQGKFFDLEFAMGLSVSPADGSVALIAKRNKLTMNDFTRILREGFKLKVPDVFPQDMYIEDAKVQFAPTGGEVGEFEIEEGFAIKGKAKLLNAMEGELDFKMNGDDGFYLDFKMDANFKEAIMKEIRKVKVIAPIMGKVLSTFEVRKVYLHLEASKDLVLAGKTDCHFKVLGKDIQFAFEGSLDFQSIKDKIIEEIIKVTGPEAAAVINAVSTGVKEAGRVASAAIGKSSSMVKKYVTLGLTKAQHGHLGLKYAKNNELGEKYCRRHCVPDRANFLVDKVLPNSINSIQTFHDRVIGELVKIYGETEADTKRMRLEYFGPEWETLTKNIEADWNNIMEDKDYVGYFVEQKWAEDGGRIFRAKIVERKQEYLRLKEKLYNSLINSRIPTATSNNNAGGFNKIKNLWKNTYINIEQGLTCGNILPGWHSAMWEFEPSEGNYVKIKNRWKGTYLNVESGNLQCTQIAPGWHSAMWEILREGNFVRIKNRWKGTYLNVESGKLQCTAIQPGWASAKWELTNAEVVPVTVDYDRSAGCGTFYRNGIYLKKHCGWLKNWHTIIRIGCLGPNFDDKILFYDKDAGIGQIYRIDKSGNMQLLLNHPGWSKNWSKITWEGSDACNGLIKFETADGYWEKYNCDDNGNINLQSKKQ